MFICATLFMVSPGKQMWFFCGDNIIIVIKNIIKFTIEFSVCILLVYIFIMIL